ncbi:Alanylphosphatidylglycerol synthase [hydrothermal vent metagenome]|uniref:Phosphatidylglycerol lysyltransferase n=1 Tax=hydrothermal vent metagenome TaxID=652676 RepID=A0A3B0V2J9_9ZZZZ
MSSFISTAVLWFKKHGSNIVIFLFFGAAIVVLYQITRQVHIHDVYRQMQAISARKIALAFLFTVLGYAALIGYDWSALRYIGKKLPFPLIAFISFTGFSLSNTIGLSWLSGGAIRYRLYSRAGLKAAETALVIAFCTVGFAIGEIIVGGIALVSYPRVLSDYFSFSPVIVRLLAAGLLLGSLAVLFIRSRRHGTIHFGKRTFRLPGSNILAGQILFSIMDIGLAGATLFILLPANSFPFIGLLAVYAVALIVGVFSQVPGGIGVFEVVMATALHRYVPLETLSSALIAYRLIYYLFPFVTGILLLVGSEGAVMLKTRNNGGLIEKRFKLIANVSRLAIPPALAGLTFISGLILLLGSSISLPARSLMLIGKFFPLELVELSHMLGGVIGIILIILSFALYQRIQAALWLSGFLFIAGAVLSFIQTLDYDRGLVMILTLALLFSSRRLFYRRARLFSNILDVKWILLTLAALACFGWLLLFSFKATPYQNDLWWKFAIDSQAPRGLRTAAIAVSTFLIVYILNVLRPPGRQVKESDASLLAAARELIKKQDNADANFALTGDKTLLFSEKHQSFIMYSIHNRSWVALGDPVGTSTAEMIELIWEFKAMAAKEQGHAVFYQVGREHLDWYIDAGFNLFKLGEEARVRLMDFSLEGAKRARLRQARNRALRDGLSFRITYPPHKTELLDELSLISEQWLSMKNVREKRYSLGRFNREYLNEFPLALVYENDHVSAFANIFSTDTRVEATIDLMRHLPKAGNNTMEFLFVELMLALKEMNFGEFSLGMVPLSGFMEHENARLWDRFGLLIYKKGRRFYNFQGLRNFKDKFNPEWVPHYLATTKKGVSPFLTLVDIAALISGGVRGVVKK